MNFFLASYFYTFLKSLNLKCSLHHFRRWTKYFAVQCKYFNPWQIFKLIPSLCLLHFNWHSFLSITFLEFTTLVWKWFVYQSSHSWKYHHILWRIQNAIRLLIILHLRGLLFWLKDFFILRDNGFISVANSR